MSWEDEFRGFFFGEGYIGIVRNGKKNGIPCHTARAQITLRMDDVAILEFFQKKLGGGIHYEGRGRATKDKTGTHFTKPYACWRMRSFKDVEGVCDILERSFLPSKKLKEVKLVRAFIATKAPPGPKPEGFRENLTKVREALVEELQALHRGDGIPIERSEKIQMLLREQN